MKQKGFTLIELLVVISIIGLLASVILVAMDNARQKARDSRRIADINQLAVALNLYLSDNGSYPTGWYDSRPWFTAPNNWTTLAPFLVPKYMTQLPVPPMNGQQDGAMCGNCDEYKYIANNNGSEFGICTYLSTYTSVGSAYTIYTNVWGPYYCAYAGCDATHIMTDGYCQ